MQHLVKNASNIRDRTLVFDCYDLSGVAADATGLTLRIVGTETAPASALGTITRLDTGSAAHEIALTQVQSDAFAIGEKGMLNVKGSGLQELNFPFTVFEDNPAVAPPTVGTIQSGLPTASQVTTIGNNVTTALANISTVNANVGTAISGINSANSALGTLATSVASVGTAVAGVGTAVAGVAGASATAVWSYVIERQLTALQWARRVGALLMGRTTGAGSGTEVFRGLRSDGTPGKVRATIPITASNRDVGTFDDTDD